MKPYALACVAICSFGFSVVACGAADDSITTADDALNVSNFVIVSPLKLDTTTVGPGGTVHATVTYKNTSDKRGSIQSLKIIGLPPGATAPNGYVFEPSDGYTHVAAGATLKLSASLAFTGSDPAGTWKVYSTFTTYTGVHDGPSVSLDVSGSSSDDGGVTDSGNDAGSEPDSGFDGGASRSPYGVTIGLFSASARIDPQVFVDMKALGLKVLRLQESWSLIEPSPGVYDWQLLDDAVSKANAAGIDLVFPFREPISNYKTVRCNPGSSNPLYQMDPSALKTFATATATRYNGKNGHGFIAAYEIGNEDFDVMFDNTQPVTVAGQVCRDPKWYVPVLQAATPAVRAASPSARVGMFGMWWEYSPHHTEFMQGLYAGGCRTLFDYANFHFYSGSVDPLTNTSSDRLSLPGQISEIYAVMKANGDANKKIHVSEMGWKAPTDVTASQQATFYAEAMDAMRTSGAVEEFDLFTINYNPAAPAYPFSIVQGTAPNVTYTPAALGIQAYAAKHPTWP